jgi:hypothetical protein
LYNNLLLIIIIYWSNYMKRILGAFLLAFLLMACSSDDDGGSYDESEPNDSAATSNDFLADGSANSAEIDPVGDYDGFHYSVTPDSMYTVTATWKSGNDLDLYLKFYDQNITNFGEIDDYEEGASESGLLRTGPSTTEVYIVVSDYWDESKGSYKISVTPLSGGGRSLISDTEDSVSGVSEGRSVKDEKKAQHWR